MNLVTLVTIALTLVATPKKMMDHSIDKKTINDIQTSLYDGNQKLYFFSTGDCDGAHLRMTLTKDLNAIVINEWGIDADSTGKNYIQRKFKSGKIPAVTNHGIRLGMTEDQVKKILGTPAKRMWSKKFKAVEFIYSYDEGSLSTDEEGFNRYSNYYLFRKGKLYYIELTKNLIGGAC